MWGDIFILIVVFCYYLITFTIGILPIALPLSIIVFLGFRITQRWYTNMAGDRYLNVKTTGVRRWLSESAKMYHRAESTPYKALRSLRENYEFSGKHRVVDFGAGKGRVAFFLHDEYGVNVTGVELNEVTIKEAKDNLRDYYSKSGPFEHKVSFQCIGAEDYKFNQDDNTYFFFNPFNHTIFKNVIDNIVEDSNNNGKDVKVILYYPTRSYRNVMRNTDFEVVDKFKAKGRISPTERFIIYERRGTKSTQLKDLKRDR